MNITEADIQRANAVPIVELVRMAGLTVVSRGRGTYTTKEHDSLILFPDRSGQHDENRWCWFSRDNASGDAIQWVRYTQNLSFEAAVEWLLDRPKVAPSFKTHVIPDVPPPPLDQNLARRFHDNMAPLDREWWLERGVPIGTQDRFLLGVCHHKLYGLCYTIPIFQNHVLVNIRLRLAHPKDPKDRYRPYDSGRGTHLYCADEIAPDVKGLVVVAGEIKADVMWSNEIPAVSPTAGCGHWRPEWTERIKHVKKVYVAYDPGEEEAAARIAGEIGARARIVILPDKPDDLVNQKGAQALRYHLKNALTVKEWRTARTVQLPESVADALHEGPGRVDVGATDRLPWKGDLL